MTPAGAKLREFALKSEMITIDHEIAVAQPPEFAEGAFMYERGGIYYQSYNHGRWNGPDYSVHSPPRLPGSMTLKDTV